MASRRNEESESTFAVRQLTLIERFNCVLYPFDILTLLEQLPTRGWIVSEALEETEDARRVSVPVKGNNRLRIDQGNKTLGVAGKVLDELVDGYREIRTFAREITPLSPDVTTHYAELRYIGGLPAAKQAGESLAEFWRADQQVTKLGAVLSESLPTPNGLLPYGVRFATVAPDANRPNWAELSILPVTLSGSAGYQFDLIYRNQDSQVVEDVAKRADEIVRSAITEIEGHSNGDGRRSRR